MLCYRNDKEESTYTAVILIKLLIDITEQTWCAIDNDDYISATLLVQLCSHIKTGDYVLLDYFENCIGMLRISFSNLK